MSTSKVKIGQRTCAAIVCEHIATGHRPILLAERSEPEDKADSGWQFLCGVPGDDSAKAQVWSLQEVIDSDLSLSSLVDSPVGTRLVRVAAHDSWETVPIEAQH